MNVLEIKPGMILKHISDINIERPQKLVVINVVCDPSMDETVQCEWISKDGIFQKVWLDAKRLEKW